MPAASNQKQKATNSKSKSIKCLNDQNPKSKRIHQTQNQTQNQNQKSKPVSSHQPPTSSPPTPTPTPNANPIKNTKRDAHTFAFDPARKTGEYVSADIIILSQGGRMEWKWNGGRAEQPNRRGGLNHPPALILGDKGIHHSTYTNRLGAKGGVRG